MRDDRLLRASERWFRLLLGGTFFEPLAAVHTTSGSASADEMTRVLVFEVRPRERP